MFIHLISRNRAFLLIFPGVVLACVCFVSHCHTRLCCHHIATRLYAMTRIAHSSFSVLISIVLSCKVHALVSVVDMASLSPSLRDVLCICTCWMSMYYSGPFQVSAVTSECTLCCLYCGHALCFYSCALPHGGCRFICSA